MDTKARRNSVLLTLLIVFSTLGCAVISQFAPTATPTSTATSTPSMTPSPTETLTLTPTFTPTPEPELSMPRITVDDLPPGFEDIPPEELGMDTSSFSDEDFQVEEVFVFVNSNDFQMIFGFNFFLTSRLDRVSFDVDVNRPESTMGSFVEGIGAENVQDQKILDGFEDVGDTQVAMTMLADLEGIPIRLDVLTFRRESMGTMVMSMTFEGETPNISLHDLGLLMDQKFQEALAAAN